MSSGDDAAWLGDALLVVELATWVDSAVAAASLAAACPSLVSLALVRLRWCKNDVRASSRCTSPVPAASPSAPPVPAPPTACGTSVRALHLRNVGVKISLTSRTSILEGAMLESTTTWSYLLSTVMDDLRRRVPPSEHSDCVRLRDSGVFCLLRLAPSIPRPEGLKIFSEALPNEPLDETDSPLDETDASSSSSSSSSSSESRASVRAFCFSTSMRAFCSSSRRASAEPDDPLNSLVLLLRLGFRDGSDLQRLVAEFSALADMPRGVLVDSLRRLRAPSLLPVLCTA